MYSALYNTLINKAADFSVRYRDPQTLLLLPSYDLWEERYALHAYTVASVIAGLRAAANFAALFQDTSLTEKYDSAADEMTVGVIWIIRYERLASRTCNIARHEMCEITRNRE
ncbi:glycoside hydrolase family 15 protein [Candidatus Nitrospira salsa]